MPTQPFLALLTGQVNGSLIKLTGAGTIDVANGVTDGEYTLEHLPEGFHPSLLAACLITGYPNVCASEKPNPFDGHEYGYSREIAFRQGGRLALSTHCYYRDGVLDSRFFLTGQASLSSFSGIDPLVETWQSGDDGSIKGQFTAKWRRDDGSPLVGDASTRYVIGAPVEIAGRLLTREITIAVEAEGNHLRLHQESALIG